MTVFRLPGDHGARRRWMLAPAIAGAVLVAVLLASGGTGPGGIATDGVTAAGPAGVAAAYGYPSSCLTVRISGGDRSFARADFARTRACELQDSFPTAMFRRFEGEWHPMFYTVSYRCPVPSVPHAVQSELALCRR